jgi:hypothetical protein
MIFMVWVRTPVHARFNRAESPVIFYISPNTASQPVSRADQLLIDMRRNQWREISPFHQCFSYDGKNT